MRRRFITLSRVIRTGMVNFVRNAWLAVAAMAVMTVTLTIILFSVVTNATFANTLKQITDKIDVSVFLKDGVSQQQGKKLLDDLHSLPDVQSAEYLSKEEALRRYKVQNADNPQLLSAISETDNPLPATIRVKPRELGQIQGIKSYLDEPGRKKIIAEVSYSGDRKQAIDRITHATDLLRKIGIAAVLIFAVISVLIIFNTIQMAIFNRRDELTIMRLLGAKTWYIRGPFVVESVIYGIFSALISVFLIHASFVASSSALQASSLGLLDINYASEYFSANFWKLLTLQIFVGMLIGAVSSIIATRRYLKFKAVK